MYNIKSIRFIWVLLIFFILIHYLFYPEKYTADYLRDGYMEQFDITLGSSWVAANCYPIYVLWKKNGSSYDMINLVY